MPARPSPKYPTTRALLRYLRGQGGDSRLLVQSMAPEHWVHFVSHVAGLPKEAPLGPGLLTVWRAYGLMSIGEALRDDMPLYVDALRRHLPPYIGPPVVLYRGEAEVHYRRGIIGIAWTTSIVCAGHMARIRSYTTGWKGEVGHTPGIVLRVEAPPECIVADAPTYGHLLKEGEHEYIIDPRMLDLDQVSVVPASDVPYGMCM